MKNIMLYFTLRKRIRDGYESSVLAEISNSEMRISINTYNTYGKTHHQRRYDIRALYRSFKNQYEVLEKINSNYNSADNFDSIDRIVIKYGGSIINN